MGFASIGLGTGLFTADVPFLVLAAAFVPSLIAIVVVAARTADSSPIAERASRAADEEQTRSRAGVVGMAELDRGLERRPGRQARLDLR